MAGKKKVEIQPENEVLEESAVLEEQPVAQTDAPVEEVAASVEPVEVEEAPSEDSNEKRISGAKIWAGIKEWGRKRIVGLKRKPQSIVLVALFITTIIWLIWLFTFSRTVSKCSAAEWCGLVVFINTLISILIIALFGNAFPKRKKANLIFVALLFVFMAAIIACDVVYYIQIDTYVKYKSNLTAADLADAPYIQQSLSYAIAHIVLMGICAILLATLPLYKRLINMINTKKEVASNDMHETIDVEDD